MVRQPEEYVWSSYHHNAWGDQSDWLIAHDEYVQLGRATEERCFAFRELFRFTPDSQSGSLQLSADPLGDSRFIEQYRKKGWQVCGLQSSCSAKKT